MQTSVFHFYGIGIAAENKPLKSRELNVVPIEQLSALDGELTFNPVERLITGQDSEGNRYELKVTYDNSITCQWLPMGSNRVTPPDIRRGELIEIRRLGDTDQFFWRTMGLRDNLRRLETAIFAFNANPRESDDNKINIENCYYFEISTHRKTITLGTSKANEEPFAYTMQINAGEGAVTLTDDIGNYIEMDSGERRIHAENADGSLVHVHQRAVLAQAADGSRLEIEDDTIHLENATGTYVDITAETIDVKADDSINLEAGTGINLKCGSSEISLTSSEITLKTPKFTGTKA